MKDSRVGAFGAMGLVWALLTKWATLSFMGQSSVLLLALVFGHSISRLCAIGLIVKLERVGDAAHSKTKPLGNQMSARQWAISATGCIGLCVLVVFVVTVFGGAASNGFTGVDMGASGLKLPVMALLLALLVSGAVTAFVGGWFKRRIGGYTGDCLGAAQQIAELSIYAVTLACLAQPSLGMGR
jgi:adenosylcobinamide-GDP ribazoletransferase